MTNRSTVVLGLLIVVCVAVIVASSIADVRLADTFGPFRDRMSQRDDKSDRFPFDGRFGGMGDMALTDRTPAIAVAAAAASYAFVFLTGALTLLLAPRNLRRMQNAFGHGGRAGLRLFAVGAFTALGVVFLTAVGLFAFVVSPLPLLLPFALLIMGWCGLVALLLAAGARINTWAGLRGSSPLADLAIGTLVLSAVGSIPILGAAIAIVIGLLSVGVAVTTRFGSGSTWSLSDYYLPQESSV